MGVPRNRSMKRTRSERSVRRIGRKEPCNDHAVKGADAALATRSFESNARPIQAAPPHRARCGGRSRARARRSPTARRARMASISPSSRTSSAKTSRPPRRIRQRSREGAGGDGLAHGDPPEHRALDERQGTHRRPSRHRGAAAGAAPSKRICSWGNQASREAGPSAEGDFDLGSAALGAIDLLRRLAWSAPPRRPPRHPPRRHAVAACQAAAGIDEHALAPTACAKRTR